MAVLDEAGREELVHAVGRVVTKAMAELHGTAGSYGAAVVIAIGLDWGGDAPMQLVGEMSANARYADPDALLEAFVEDAIPVMLAKRGPVQIRKARQS